MNDDISSRQTILVSPETKSSQWWRWPLMPLGAIGAFIAAGFIWALIFWIQMQFFGETKEGWDYRYFHPVLTSGFSGFFYVLAACGIAPSHKMVAGTVMTTILGCALVVLVCFVWVQHAMSTSEAVMATINSIAALVGSLIGIGTLREQGDI